MTAGYTFTYASRLSGSSYKTFTTVLSTPKPFAAVPIAGYVFDEATQSSPSSTTPARTKSVTSSTPSSSSRSSGLSSGAKVGIGIGVGAGALALGLLMIAAFYFVRKKKREERLPSELQSESKYPTVATNTYEQYELGVRSTSPIELPARRN